MGINILYIKEKTKNLVKFWKKEGVKIFKIGVVYGISMSIKFCDTNF
jgi:cytochrome bd-type quinol oxidase subunit 1